MPLDINQKVSFALKLRCIAMTGDSTCQSNTNFLNSSRGMIPNIYTHT